MRSAEGPLAGVRVLEMGRLVAAPFCGQNLADLGADVIKVERVGTGDDARGYGPPFLDDDEGMGKASVYYLAFNRNKRSIAIDFASLEGAELIRKLAAKCDVMIENYKVGSLRKYGLDEQSIHAVNPDIVYLSVSGFGQSGPYAHRPATDVVIQGMAGFMSINGAADGPPFRSGIPVMDIMTGLYCTTAVVSALFARGKGSGGPFTWPKVALLDTGIAAMNPAMVTYELTGRPLMRQGNEGQGSSPSGLFACKDGEILLQAGKDADFAKLCRILDCEDLVEEEQFSSLARRVENHAQIMAIIAGKIARRERAELYEALVASGIICGPVNRIDEALDDPQVRASGIRQNAGHARAAGLHLAGSPIRFSEDIDPIRRPPPGLGEHTAEILGELLGMDDAQSADLAGKGVIQQCRRSGQF
jgi:crotonobetainyl-CoA:carnitine CoA-transferase CaiB-like acyl-CoA transferase